MKKLILIILLVLACSSCKAANRIYYDMYIASIGFERTDSGYRGYFYLPSSVDVGDTEKASEGKAAEVAKVEGDTLHSVFSNLDLSTTLSMNLDHISSIVLNENMMNESEIDKLIEYVKNSNSFDYNFYLFVTNSKIEDVYSLKNPNDESVILSVLCDPIANNTIYTTIEPPHFLNFCRDYYSNQIVGIPLIASDAIWNDKDDSIYCDKVGYYNKGIDLYKGYNDSSFRFLKNHKRLDYSDDSVSVIFKDYKIKIKYDDSVDISISSKYEVLYSNSNNINDYLKIMLENGIENLINKNQEIDFLNLQYNNSLNKKININIDLEEK